MRVTDLPIYYNASDILFQNLPKRGDKPALYSAERNMTFQEVCDEVSQVGNALRDMGVRFGDRVGILAPDSPEWVTAFFGTIRIGAIAIGMNTMLEPENYDFIFHDSRARAVIVHESLRSRIGSARMPNSDLKHIIVIGQPQDTSDISYEEWISGQSKALEPAQTHRDDFCTLNYSSGTTGEPKGVFHAHKDYPLIAQLSGVNLFGINKSDRTFSAAKLFFVYGIGGNLIMPWHVGAGTVLCPEPSRMIVSILNAIGRFRPTVFFSVPTVYTAISAMTNFAGQYDISSLRLCISAGEALPASVWHEWKRQTGLEILDTIGCTESLHTFMANREGDIRAGSSGRPSPGYDVKLLDDDGAEVKPGEIGNLMVKGDTIALSYLHQYEKSRKTFRGEWLFTGDKYYVDEDGYYWHAGRSDDMLKVGGLWVSPIEVEDVIMRHPAVFECAVAGQPDKTGLIRPKAFIILHKGYSPSPSLLGEILQHCSKELPDYKRPRWFEFADALPKTATGKIQRFKLRTAGPDTKM